MQSDYSKSPPARHHGLKNIKAIFGDFPKERPTQYHDTKSKSSLASKEAPTAGKVRKLLRAWWSKTPWDDYTHVAYLRTSPQSRLVCQNASYFDLAVMRERPSSPDDLHSFKILSRIHHANIAKTYDVYFDDGMTFVIMEYLDLSFVQVDFEKHPLEEWEIATIIVQVLKGVGHLLSMGLSCRSLSIGDIHLSIKGDIKIVLDPQTFEQNQDDSSEVLLDVPVLAEIIEEMMLPRYHLDSDGEGWSEEALDFLSCSLSGSIQSMMSHCFLKNAMSPKRLIPRIRLVLNTHYQDDKLQ